MASIKKNKSGYPYYASSGKLCHIAAAEKKVGGAIKKGYEVHHKNQNKMDWSQGNVAVLKKSFHQSVVHKTKKSNRSFWGS